MERLASTYAASPLVFWVLGSVLVYALATNLHWLARSSNIWRSPYARWAIEIGRFLFFLCIPYLALGGWPREPFSALLSPADMGLAGFTPLWPASRWLEAIGTATGLGLLFFFGLLVAWISASHSADGTRRWGNWELRFPYRPWWAISLNIVYLQIHWAFYRGALIVLRGDVYSATFLGLGLVYTEWAMNPFWRQGWRAPRRAGVQWLQAALALSTAVIYLLTRNLWACLAVHIFVELAFWGIGRERPAAPNRDGHYENATGNPIARGSPTARLDIAEANED